MASPRNTTAYVSAYQPTRPHVTRMVRGEVTPLTAEFSGAMPAGTTIASVTWRCSNPWPAYMADAAIDETRATVNLTAQWGYCSAVKCTATLSDGRVLAQLFELKVQEGPWFQGELPNPPSGPYSLTVDADLPDEGPPP